MRGVNCEPPPDSAGADKDFVIQFQCLQHQCAVRIGHTAVAGDALAAAVVNGQRRQFARLQAGLVLGRRRNELKRIPAADADRVCLHLAPRAKFVDRVVRIGGAYAVETDCVAARHCGRLRLAVEYDQLVLGLQQCNGQLFANEQVHVEVGRHAQSIDIEGKQFVDGLAAAEFFSHQRLGQSPVFGAGQGYES